MDKTVADVAAVFRQRHTGAIEEIAGLVRGESRDERTKETIRGITRLMRTMRLPSTKAGDKHPKGFNMLNDLLRGVVSDFAGMIDSRLDDANTTTGSVVQDLELTDLVEEAVDLSVVEDSNAHERSVEPMEDELEVQVSPDEWKNWLREATTGGIDGSETLTDDDEPMENNNEDSHETKETNPK